MDWIVYLHVLFVVTYGSKGSQELALTPEGDQARFVGDTFFVSCSSQDPDLRVQGISWTHNGMLVSTDITQPVHVEMRGDGEAADILFQGVRNGDDGDYTCSGVLGGKRVQDSFALTVHNPVSFEDTPTVQAAVAGADFTLECRVKGEPPPVVTWKHQHVGNKKKFKAQGSRLTIHYVARKDAGVYICKAAQITNQGSVVKTQPITLHVQYAPLAVEGRVDKAYGYIGARVNMTCSVDADPPADFSWTHEGRPMNTTDDVEFFRDNNTSVLSVMVNGESIYGKYVCDAENSIGNVKQEVNLEKGEPPPVPTLEKITPIGPTSIRIRILPTLSLHHLLKVTGYRIQYKKDIRDRDWQDGRYKDFKASGGEYYVIDALEKGQRYVIRAAAQNQAGYSAYSEARKVQLPPEVQDNGAEWPASNPSVLLAVVAGRMLVGKL